jgi:hypothetical protein
MSLSITRNDAKIYIARPLGGGDNPDAIAMAEEVLLRGFSDWQNQHDWEFLLKDNTDGFIVTGCSLNSGNTTVVAPSSGAFDGINVGVSVTGTNIPALTKVASYTRGTDGTVASMVLTIAPTGTSTTDLTFSGLIPIIAGTSDYNLPSDFYKHYGVRLVTNLKWPLTFVRPRDWNRVTFDQTTRTSPEMYTIFNSRSGLTQDKGTTRMRLYGVPSNSDTLRVDYYRKFDVLADPLDMDSEFLYKFLDYCRSLIIITKRGFDDPNISIKDANRAFDSAVQGDEEATEDQDLCWKSQMEMFPGYKTTWSNGAFWPDYGGY